MSPLALPAPLADPIAVPDTFATGFLMMEAVSPGIVRATAVVAQNNLYTGEAERVVVQRIVAPQDAWRELALRILQTCPAGKLSYETAESIAAACGTRRAQ